jgi:catechol 2,3-dioxygenase-like lactoylglutathione lyase family enzyme
MAADLAIKGAHHVAVVVSDLARAEGFYAGFLGLSVMQRWTDDAGAPRSIWVDLGDGTFLAIERARVDGPIRDAEAPGHHCLALRIACADRERWRDKLVDAGHAIVRETAFSIFVRDPDGALVALSHYPEAA